SPAHAEDLVEPFDEEVGAVPGDAQWWLDLEHVRVVAGGVVDDAELAQPFADRCGLLGCRLPGLGISYQLDSLVEAAAVDAADDRVPLGERPEPLRQVPAHSCGVVLQVLLANRVEDRQADG